jgi:tetratricopeptide (TPR) repeat protein
MRFLLCAFLLHVGAIDDPNIARSLNEAERAVTACDYARAVAIYEGCRREAPSDAGVRWRMARVYVLMAEVAVGSEADRLLRSAEEAGRICILLDSAVAEGHTWLAASLGYQALTASASVQIRMAREVLSETAKALAINPNDDVACSIRGSTFRALGNVNWLKKNLARIFLGGVPDGGFPEAEEALRRAIKIAPHVMRHQYELAVLCIDRGRYEEAGQLLLRASRMPVRIASDTPRLETIGRLLARYFPDGVPGEKEPDTLP